MAPNKHSLLGPSAGLDSGRGGGYQREWNERPWGGEKSSWQAPFTCCCMNPPELRPFWEKTGLRGATCSLKRVMLKVEASLLPFSGSP